MTSFDKARLKEIKAYKEGDRYQSKYLIIEHADNYIIL